MYTFCLYFSKVKKKILTFFLTNYELEIKIKIKNMLILKIKSVLVTISFFFSEDFIIVTKDFDLFYIMEV